MTVIGGTPPPIYGGLESKGLSLFLKKIFYKKIYIMGGLNNLGIHHYQKGRYNTPPFFLLLIVLVYI